MPIKKRTRVLIIAPSLAILGGQAVQAAQLLENLSRESSIEVAFLPVNPQLPGVLRHLQSVKYLRTVVTSVAYWVALLTQVRRYDVLHVFSASYLSFLIAPTPAILSGRLFGRKVILNYRSGEAEDHLRRWRWTVRPVLRLVDAIAVPSDYLVHVFARFGHHASAIFNIVDHSRFRFRERQPLRPIFLSNRNFEPHYNVSAILRAFAVIKASFPEAKLIVAGDGSQRRDLEWLAEELGIEVEFLGPVRHSNAPDLYDSADIYLNASEIDNMPSSIIESFAAGLPVVSTNAGGIPYIVCDGRTGLLVECGDYNGLAECAIKLLRNDQLAFELTNTARAECDKYRWSAVRTKWLTLYNQLANGTEGESSLSD